MTLAAKDAGLDRPEYCTGEVPDRVDRGRAPSGAHRTHQYQHRLFPLWDKWYGSGHHEIRERGDHAANAGRGHRRAFRHHGAGRTLPAGRDQQSPHAAQ